MPPGPLGHHKNQKNMKNQGNPENQENPGFGAPRPGTHGLMSHSQFEPQIGVNRDKLG